MINKGQYLIQGTSHALMQKQAFAKTVYPPVLQLKDCIEEASKFVIITSYSSKSHL